MSFAIGETGKIMERREFKSIGKEISLLGFGLMRLPTQGQETKAIDYPVAEAMVDEALAQGINYFDTGYFYHDGLSEPFAGKALGRHPRDGFLLATKLPAWLVDSRDGARRLFEEQLSRLGTDRLDFYLFHNLNAGHWDMVERMGLYEVFAGLRDEGVIGRLGFSMHDGPAHLRRVLDGHDFDFAQIQLNYIDWESLGAREMYGLLSSRGIPVVVMEPVRGGALAALPAEAAGKLRDLDPRASQASWALRFAASLPGVMTVLSGMSDPGQLRDNLATFNDYRPLGQAECDLLLGEVATSFNLANPVPCTGCRYCMDCPSGVNIPLNIAAYNEYRYRASMDPKRGMAFFGLYFASLADAEGAENCQDCGECQDRCPQRIGIPALMREIEGLAREA
jgi:predicted aldo/keto reductase-like oxidoreductase